MKKNKSAEFLCCLLVLCLMMIPVFGQKRPRPIIFAVLNDGQNLEPVAFIEKGKLTNPVDGADPAATIAGFTKSFYKPKTTYRLIFGGANSGTVTIKSADPKAECSANQAMVSAQSKKAKLKGFVMALATNAPTKKTGSGVRRLPTAAERAAIEALVRAEFTNQKVPAEVIKNLHYHNLTALDIDNDKRVELVGSFWVETSATERALLFFIADQGTGGKYAFGYSQFETIKQADVMNGEIKAVDEGIYHELLLDVFDYDDDGAGEIFTYSRAFEGASFNAYRREGGKWVKAFEDANYHCAF